MTEFNYREYVQSLWRKIEYFRQSGSAAAQIQFALFRDGCGYRSYEELGAKRSKTVQTGLLTSDNWRNDSSGSAEREIARFLSLSEIYAFTDEALDIRRHPLRNAHWDTTLALVEMAFLADGGAWHQRMLFAGFANRDQADFLTTIDGDILASKRVMGQQLFEWRPLSEKTDGTDRTIVNHLSGNTPRAPHDRRFGRLRRCLARTTRSLAPDVCGA